MPRLHGLGISQWDERDDIWREWTIHMISSSRSLPKPPVNEDMTSSSSHLLRTPSGSRIQDVPWRYSVSEQKTQETKREDSEQAAKELARFV